MHLCLDLAVMCRVALSLDLAVMCRVALCLELAVVCRVAPRLGLAAWPWCVELRCGWTSLSCIVMC